MQAIAQKMFSYEIAEGFCKRYKDPIYRGIGESGFTKERMQADGSIGVTRQFCIQDINKFNKDEGLFLYQVSHNYYYK